MVPAALKGQMVEEIAAATGSPATPSTCGCIASRSGVAGWRIGTQWTAADLSRRAGGRDRGGRAHETQTLGLPFASSILDRLVAYCERQRHHHEAESARRGAPE